MREGPTPTKLRELKIQTRMSFCLTKEDSTKKELANLEEEEPARSGRRQIKNQDAMPKSRLSFPLIPIMAGNHLQQEIQNLEKTIKFLSSWPN